MPRATPSIGRRQCLARLGWAASALALAPLSGCAIPGRRRGPANVVLIVADDQGSTDLGCYGALDLHLPALDGLAARGLRFTQFYVAAPTSMASRASLLTGRQHPRAVGPDGLRGEEVTIAEMLRQAGYATACFGKWHLGHLAAQSPLAQGFDEFLGFKVGAMDNYSHFYYWGGRHRHVLLRGDEPHREDGVYFPDLVAREALRFIDAHRDRPFFLYLPFNIPHYPLQPEARYLAEYEGLADVPRRMYAAFLTAMDARIGQVLTRLDELGLRQDTIVLYLSDHGHSEEERAFGGGGRAAPFRGHKGTLLEGGIRVPFLLSAPGRVPEGEVRDQCATSMDLLPTIAALTGAALPACALDGRSLAPVLAAASAPPVHESLFWAYDKWWVARQANWKALGDVDANKMVLYDLAADPGESRNVAGSNPAVVAFLVDAFSQFIEGLRADPSVRAEYEPAPDASD